MYGLSRSALEKVVDDGSDKEFVAVALRMDETFVGVDHLLEVDGAVHIVRERGIPVAFGRCRTVARRICRAESRRDRG